MVLAYPSTIFHESAYLYETVDRIAEYTLSVKNTLILAYWNNPLTLDYYPDNEFNVAHKLTCFIRRIFAFDKVVLRVHVRRHKNDHQPIKEIISPGKIHGHQVLLFTSTKKQNSLQLFAFWVTTLLALTVFFWVFSLSGHDTLADCFFFIHHCTPFAYLINTVVRIHQQAW